MTIQEWFSMQQKLDQYIEAEHGLQDRSLFDEKILALLVEIGELANETRCFKFWSKKPASESDVILEEYVDGIHFILSLGLELGFAEHSFSVVSHEGNEDLVTGFLKIYQRVEQLRQSRSLRDYEELLRGYFILGQSLGFTIDDAQQAYKKKNEINYKRQEEGY
ncbi:dUTP diphosphatase [Lederbergia sp. NSJ-179]|uniref:dUTP diphosphatase n=1 Tax=Lederbergia sp. NSJ-179 TaxID=2931402 RepID=UPI001FD30370|nr:dUTP diphosphatase [Lederbergia sp. NSJ-179]MCJ7839803.1 dUTP diphosphatase [Lederbergia sp. NSJ-179]